MLEEGVRREENREVVDAIESRFEVTESRIDMV